MRNISLAAGALATIAIGTTRMRPQVRASTGVHDTAPATCKKLKPCFIQTNQGTGAAIKGVSLDSTVGKFGQANPSATGATVVAQAAGLGAVSASSKQGYGGEFQSSTGAGLIGISTNAGLGSFGEAAILAQANGLGGIYSYSKQFYGGEFESGGNTYALVAASDSDAGTAFLAEGSSHGLGPEIEGLSVRPELVHTNQAAIVAQAAGLSGVYGFSSLNAGGAFESASGTSLIAQADAADGISFAAQGPGGFTIFDGSGNGNFGGTVSAAGFVTVTAQHGERARAAYNAASTRDSLEDTGTAQLTNGTGIVRFDSALAESIDVRDGYQVFLTADGDVRGLYVAQKFARGFVVRESRNGRSSISFDYRIVAHRAGSQDARLPEIPLPNPPRLMHHRSLVAPRLSPPRPAR